jgi:nicotinamidase-related amidase
MSDNNHFFHCSSPSSFKLKPYRIAPAQTHVINACPIDLVNCRKGQAAAAKKYANVRVEAGYAYRLILHGGTMNPELLDRNRSALVIIDVQERLFPSIYDHDRVLTRIDLLLSAAELMRIPLLVTEQYPKGLGNTIEELRRAIPRFEPLVKMDFSCVPAPGFRDRLAELQRDQVVLAGIETHVCLAQTALDLASGGGNVFVAADASGSRRPLDAQIAIQRLDRNGITITTAEAVVFEWLRRAGTEEFKAIQPKLKMLK